MVVLRSIYIIAHIIKQNHLSLSLGLIFVLIIFLVRGCFSTNNHLYDVAILFYS